MIVGCYDLQLYCDHPAHPTYPPGPHAQYVNEHGSVCRKTARKRGWVLDMANGRALCPRCAKLPRPENWGTDQMREWGDPTAVAKES